MNVVLGLLWLAQAAPTEFTMTLPVSPETPEGQRLIAQRAIEFCAGRFPQLIRYRFTGDETIAPDGTRQSRFEVRQELTCLDSPPPPPQLAPLSPPDWRPSEEDERAVRTLTERYFAMVDRGDAEGIHQLWSEGERAAVSVEERAAQLEAFRRQAGTPGRHRLVRLTWYVNPQNAPARGIYVAVDFERTYDGLLLNCGYVVWFRDTADHYVLLREESNTLARSDSDGSPQSLAEARRLMQCEGR